MNEWDIDELNDFGLDLPDNFLLTDESGEDEVFTDEDEIPEQTVEPKCKLGDIWLLGEHRLMCGDSTLIDDVEKLMNNITIDCIFTDPPYGINVDTNVDTNASTNKRAGNGVANKHNFGKILNDDSIECAREFYTTVTNLFKKDTCLVMWGANYYDFLPPSKCWISWYKRENLPSDTFCDTEFAYTNQKIHSKTICVQWKGMIKQGEQNCTRVHPTQKPILLVEESLNYLKAGKYIFDGFGGSGSTLIACEKTKRVNYSMELDPKYCDVILQRWQNYTKKDAILESTKQKFNEI